MSPKVMKELKVGELVAIVSDGGAGVGYIDGALVICVKNDIVSATILNVLNQCSMGEVMEKLQAAVKAEGSKETIQ